MSEEREPKENLIPVYDFYDVTPFEGYYRCPACKLTNASAQDMAKTAGQMWKYCPVCGVRIRYDRDNDDVSDVGVREYITEDEFERRYIGGSLRNRGDK